MPQSGGMGFFCSVCLPAFAIQSLLPNQRIVRTRGVGGFFKQAIGGFESLTHCISLKPRVMCETYWNALRHEKHGLNLVNMLEMSISGY
jgi:hypothetical protein